MTITVYTKLVCPQCDSTYRALFTSGLDYEGFEELTGIAFSVKVVDNSPEDLEFIKGLGYLQAPVVVVEHPEDGIDHWSGFRPDKIDEVVARLDGIARLDSSTANAKFKELKERLKAEAAELVAA